MPRKPILVEKTGHGWGVALGPGGRFVRIRVPPGAGLGDELQPTSARIWYRSALAAAVVFALFLGTLAFMLPRSYASTYALVTLRFAPALQPASAAEAGEAQQIQQIRMTLALDRQGTVAAVRPQAQTTQKLLGMRIEQAIHHTVDQYTPIAGGDVEVRPRRCRPDRETADLEARIRTALPVCVPPIRVAIGPPFEDDEEIAPPREDRERRGRKSRSTEGVISAEQGAKFRRVK